MIIILITSCVNSSLSEIGQYESNHNTTNDTELTTCAINGLIAIEKLCDSAGNKNTIDMCNLSNTTNTSNIKNKNVCQGDDSRPSSSISDNNNVSLQHMQTANENNTFANELKECDVKSMNSIKNNIEHTHMKKNVIKVHADMLCVFWYVSYGYYRDCADNKRLYILYDDRTFFFMKGNIFMENPMPYDDIIYFINKSYKQSKHYTNTSVFVTPTMSEHCNGTEDSEHRQHHISYNDNWISALIYYYKKDKVVSDLLKVLKEKMDDCNNIDIKCVNSIDSFIYLIKNADVFFELLSIDCQYFRLLININSVYCNQIDRLFIQNVTTKLYVFPELLSLYKHYDTIKPMNHSENNNCKMYTVCYVLGRFEKFIELFKTSLLCSDLRDLYREDLAFLKIYVVELYLTYLFNVCFNASYQCIIMYVIMNRLQAVSVYDADLHTCKLMEFMLYNLFDLNPICENKFADQLINKLLEKQETVVIVNDMLRILLGENKCVFSRIANSLVTNIDRIQSGCISKRILIDMCHAESAYTGDTGRNAITDKFITKIKEELLQSILNKNVKSTLYVVIQMTSEKENK